MAARPVQRDPMTPAQQKTQKPAARATASVLLLLFVALRSLSSSRLTSALAMLSVAISVGFQVPNSANLRGYRQELLRHAVRLSFGEVRVRPQRGAYLKNVAQLKQQLSTLQHVVAVHPALVLPGAVEREGQFRGSSVIGIELTSPVQPLSLRQGRLPSPGALEVVVGSAMAERLALKLGDKVTLHIVFIGEDAVAPVQGRGAYEMSVCGFAEGVFSATDQLFVDRSFLVTQADTPDPVSLMLIYSQPQPDGTPLDDEQSQQLAVQVRQALTGQPVQVSTWSEDSPSLRGMLRSISVVTAVSLTMVLAAVVLPVSALLYIHMLRRRRDVALLGVLGFTRRDIFLSYALHGVLIGAAGVLLGCGLGALLVLLFIRYPLFASEGFVIRPALTWAALLRPSLFLFAATVISSLLPAARAARQDAATVLRGEQ